MTDYKYDLAFSFTFQDEGVATQLNDLLAPKMKTFIYYDRQKDLAGTDGQETFSAVYGAKARCVAILYRPEWGTTRWTRVEMDAIKHRYLNDGWNFATFIATVENPVMPPWLPQQRLYASLPRFGVASAAAVLEARVTEQGGQAHEESVIDRAARFKREQEFRDEAEQFQRSERGVQAARAAFAEFSAALEAAVAALKPSIPQIDFQESQGYRIVQGLYPTNMIANFRTRYANALDEAKMEINLYKGFPDIPGYRGSISQASTLKSMKLQYRLVGPGRAAYVTADAKALEFTPTQLAEVALKFYMDVAEKQKA